MRIAGQQRGAAGVFAHTLVLRQRNASKQRGWRNRVRGRAVHAP